MRQRLCFSSARIYVGNGNPLGQYRDHTVVTKSTDHAIEGHGRDVIEHGTPLQTEPTVGGQQRIAGHIRPHRAVAQHEVRQDGEDRFAGGALDAPDGEAAQTTRA